MNKKAVPAAWQQCDTSCHAEMGTAVVFLMRSEAAVNFFDKNGYISIGCHSHS